MYYNLRRLFIFMKDVKINLLLNRQQRKNKLLAIGKIVISLFLVIFIILGFFSYRLIASKNGPKTGFGQNLAEEIKMILDLKHLIIGSDKLLNGEREDRINILLLGIGGQGHNGPNLTDTVIIAGIQPSTQKIALLSTPRDLFVPIPGYGWRKINDANALGEAEKKGSGPLLTQATVNQVFNLPIHYYIRADFKGFKKIIDDLGGITVLVDRSFTDGSYPTNNDLYQTVSFKAGWQKMDGDTALKYVRSRHGNNGEGSDFARSLRQQKVLEAIKNKIFSFSFILNPTKISAVLEDLGEDLKTNLEPWEMIKIIKFIKDTKKEDIVSKVLDNGPSGPLYSDTENGAYVLLPKTGDFSELQSIARNLINTEKQQNALTPITADRQQKLNASVEIQNGTKVNGLAARYTEEFKKSDFNIIHIGNAERQDYLQTIIYDLTGGRKIEDLEKIKNLLKNKIEEINVLSFSTDLSDNSSLNLNRQADFVIILGQNADKDSSEQ